MLEDKEACAEKSKSQKEEEVLLLLDLPVEIILHICSFLDSFTLVHRLSLVCKYFYGILNDDSLWKVRISQTWPNSIYPVLPPSEDDDLFWKLSCVAIERQKKLWKNNDDLEHISLKNIHSGTIDGILLMQNGQICISGGRDRSLACTNLTTNAESTDSTIINLAHDGWIWDLTAIDDVVYSCSWDRNVKCWKLTDSGLVHEKTYENLVNTALLCVASHPGSSLFATGSFCKKILLFDSRAQQETSHTPVALFEGHQRAVVRLAMSANYLLSASEDKKVIVWDQRTRKILKTIEIAQDSFPLSISMQENIVYVGDSHGNLHVLSPKKNFEKIKTFAGIHKKGINGVRQAPGCLFTSSLDKTAKVFSPTDPPQNITTLLDSSSEIARIDYLNEVLAVSGADAIEIWRPKRA